MTILIHGADQAKSRQKLNELLKDKDSEKIYLEGKKFSLNELIQASESSSLIATDKTIIIENFLKRKIGKEKKEIQEFLFKKKFDYDVILWEDKELERAKISSLPKTVAVYKFDYPANLFKFLDSLGSSPVKKLLEEFHFLAHTSDPELLYTMLVRQFRFLLMVKDENTNLTGIPDWQFYKFKSQSKYFSFVVLLSLYRRLLNIDYQFKTGRTPLNKSKLLDLFLASP